MIKREDFVLERLMISLRKMISKKFLKDEDKEFFKFTIQQWANEIYINFYKDFAGLKDNKNISFQFPKTWKDHFKLQHRNNWFIKKRLKKHPIEFVRHEYDILKMLVFPDFKIPHGEEFKENFIVYQVEGLLNETSSR